MLQKSFKGEQKNPKNANFKLTFSPVTSRQVEEESSPYSCRNRTSVQSSQLNGIEVTSVEDTITPTENKYELHNKTPDLSFFRSERNEDSQLQSQQPKQAPPSRDTSPTALISKRIKIEIIRPTVIKKFSPENSPPFKRETIVKSKTPVPGSPLHSKHEKKEVLILFVALYHSSIRREKQVFFK